MPDILIVPNDSPQQVLDVLWGHMNFPESPDRAFELMVRASLQRSGMLSVPNTEPVTLPAAWLKATLNK